MSKLRMQYVQCQDCEHEEERLVDLEVGITSQHCSCCDGVNLEILALMGMPTVMNVALPDGTKRLTGEKIWSKLNVERVNKDWRDPERKKIEKEMKRVNRRAK